MKRKSDDDEQQSDAKRARTDAPEGAPVQEGLKAGDWNCPGCRHLNYAFRIYCQKCRTGKDGGSDPSFEGGQSTNAGKHPGDWNCPGCNYHNYASRSVCQKCMIPKPFGPPPGVNLGKHPGDWLCSRCNDLNFASRPACRKCGAPSSTGTRPHDFFGSGNGYGPPGAYGGGGGGYRGGYGGGYGGGGGGGGGGGPHDSVRPGDWNCPQCNDHNYASRPMCRKCGTAKTESAVIGAEGGGAGGYGGGGGYGAGPGGYGAGASGYGASPAPASGGYGGAYSAAASYGYESFGGAPPSGPPPSSGYGGGGAGGYGPGGGGGYGGYNDFHRGAGGASNPHGETRPGDWNCPSCGDHNYASRMQCRKCGSDKGGMGGGGGGMGHGGHGGHGGGGGGQGGRLGDWICPNCSDHNYASRPACRRCGTSKTKESVEEFKSQLVPGGDSGPGNSSGKHPGDWNCPSCYHLNYASRTVCRLCNGAKP